MARNHNQIIITMQCKTKKKSKAPPKFFTDALSPVTSPPSLSLLALSPLITIFLTSQNFKKRSDFDQENQGRKFWRVFSSSSSIKKKFRTKDDKTKWHWKRLNKWRDRNVFSPSPFPLPLQKNFDKIAICQK